MVEKRIESDPDACHAIRTRRNGCSQKCFGFGRVLIVKHFKRQIFGLNGVRPPEKPVSRRPAETRKDFCKLGDVDIIISFNRVAAAIQARLAIRLQFKQADGEKLHDLARVIFIGHHFAVFVRFLVLQIGEIDRHRRAVGDVFKRLAKVAEGAGGHDVHIIGHGDGPVLKLRVVIGSDQDLRQCETNALAQLVVAQDGALPEGFRQLLRADLNA